MGEIHRFLSLPSTMHKAVELAAAGHPNETVVVASEQTQGMGRFGRSWHSEANAGLYMSEVLRLDISPDRLPLVTLALGLATAEAIALVTGAAPDLRWPNDVLLNGRKCAGILVQLHDGVLIAGIGINVNHTSFPPDLSGLATSIRIETGREFDRDVLLEQLIVSIHDSLENLLHGGREPILRAFAAASSYVTGRRVTVEQSDGNLTGVTEGLDPQGFLWLRRDDGQRTLILAGGVRPE